MSADMKQFFYGALAFVLSMGFAYELSICAGSNW